MIESIENGFKMIENLFYNLLNIDYKYIILIVVAFIIFYIIGKVLNKIDYIICKIVSFILPILGLGIILTSVL